MAVADSSDNEPPEDSSDDEPTAMAGDAVGPVQVGTQTWLVERVAATRVSVGTAAGDTHRKGTVLYKVYWVGCSEEEATWEPKSYIAPELIAAFEASQEHAEVQPPGSPHAEKRERPAGSSDFSPSAKSPDAKRQESQVEHLD